MLSRRLLLCASVFTRSRSGDSGQPSHVLAPVTGGQCTARGGNSTAMPTNASRPLRKFVRVDRGWQSDCQVASPSLSAAVCTSNDRQTRAGKQLPRARGRQGLEVEAPRPMKRRSRPTSPGHPHSAGLHDRPDRQTLDGRIRAAPGRIRPGKACPREGERMPNPPLRAAGKRTPPDGTLRAVSSPADGWR